MRKLVVVLVLLGVLAPATALAGGWATVKLSSTPVALVDLGRLHPDAHLQGCDGQTLYRLITRPTRVGHRSLGCATRISSRTRGGASGVRLQSDTCTFHSACPAGYTASE